MMAIQRLDFRKEFFAAIMTLNSALNSLIEEQSSSSNRDFCLPYPTLIGQSSALIVASWQKNAVGDSGKVLSTSLKGSVCGYVTTYFPL